MKDRAVSTMVSYTLLLAVTAILISGLSIAAGGLVESQQKQTVSEELDVIQERVVSDIQTADRLAQSEEKPEAITVTSETPQQISSGSYSIVIENNSGDTKISLHDPETDITTEAVIETGKLIEEVQLSGGTLKISYEDDALVITNG